MEVPCDYIGWQHSIGNQHTFSRLDLTRKETYGCSSSFWDSMSSYILWASRSNVPLRRWVFEAPSSAKAGSGSNSKPRLFHNVFHNFDEAFTTLWTSGFGIHLHIREPRENVWYGKHNVVGIDHKWQVLVFTNRGRIDLPWQPHHVETFQKVTGRKRSP